MSGPQVDATTLVDRDELERRVQDVYRHVAHDPVAPRHFEIGRSLALRLGYPEALLDGVPYLALASFAGVGYHLDLAELKPGDSVLDLGSGSGTDVFAASLVVGASGWVVGVDFTGSPAELQRRLERRVGPVQLTMEMHPAGAALHAYFGGKLIAPQLLQTAILGTPFQRQVWSALRRIPAGKTITYGELASWIGRPSAVRAVASANGDNPWAIVVPCHRVIGADGSLTGYGGGIERKRWLLKHEGALLL